MISPPTLMALKIAPILSQRLRMGDLKLGPGQIEPPFDLKSVEWEIYIVNVVSFTEFDLFMFGVIRLRVQKSYQEYHMCNMILNAPPIYISARPVCTSLRLSGGTVPMSL